MMSKPSAGDIAGHLELFLKHQLLEVSAKRRGDMPDANRHVEKVTKALDALAEAGPEGRSELERLMEDPDPSTRGRAARRVKGWDPESAIPVLATLLHESLDPRSESAEAVIVRMEARNALLEHFGLDMFDPTDLPARLADMGISLPEETARRMRRER